MKESVKQLSFTSIKAAGKLFFKQCYLPAFILNFIIEIFSRESFWKPLLYFITNPFVFLYNALIIAVSLSLCLFFKRRRFVQALICLLWFAIGFTDFILLQFRTTPFTFVDLLLLDSAFSIMGHYLTIWQIVLLAVAVLLAIAGCVLLFFRAKKLPPAIPFIPRAFFSASMLLITLLFTKLGMGVGLLERNFGNIAQSFHTNGLPYCFMNSVFNMGIAKPASYSDETVQSILDSIEPSPLPTQALTPLPTPAPTNAPTIAPEGQTTPTASPSPLSAKENPVPNILFLQLESFFDPTHIKDAVFTSDPVPVYRSLKENYSSGYLKVPSFGAGTANTEFEVLTGMNLDFFGPGEYPYKTILKKSTCESLAFNLSALDLTPHAIHNNDATFYGRNLVFSQLGFQTFTAIEYMSGYELTPLGWAKDSCLTGEILETLDSTTEKDFIYTISVQGHGAYPEEALLENPAVDLTLPEELNDSYYGLLYFVNQLHEMDSFLKELLLALDSYPEDVVLVLYGDHLPSFKFTEEQLDNGSLYETEYVIWSNFPMERKQLDLEAYQLSAYVLDRLDIHEGLLTKYHQTKQETPDYLENLEVLEYDMLYGDLDCYDGVNPYVPSTLQLGIRPIEITAHILRRNTQEESENLLYVKGRNFTEYSVVFLNEEEYETIYINAHTLAIKGFPQTEEFEIVVKQIGKDHAVLTETAPYRFLP